MSLSEEFPKRVNALRSGRLPSSQRNLPLHIPKPSPGLIGRLMEKYELSREAFADKFGLTPQELNELEKKNGW